MTTALDQDAIVRYEPRGAARELFRAREAEVFIAGPAGTGKSLACLFRLHLTALHNPNIRCLIVRKTAVSLGATTLVTYEKKVAADTIARGIVRWFGGSPREAPGYRYSNGAKIDVAGMDKPEKIMSAEYDLVFVDEATELAVGDWEAIGTRLRNGILSWQQQMGACNPAHPTHWIKQRCDQGQARMLVSRHVDNPAYMNADGTPTEVGRDYFAKLDALTGVRKLRLRDGTWAAAEGLIYEEFDEAVHLVDQFTIPHAWTRWITVDFGFTNPFVMQWWAEDPDGRLFLYREIYHTRRLVEDHARQARGLMVYPSGQWREPQPRAVICDHDAEDRATLEKHLQMGTSAAHKSVSDGIQAFQSRLKLQQDGRARLFIVRGALVERDPELDAARKPACTQEEITGYVWQVKPGGAVPEVPLKENDHGMDAGRYMVAERDLGGRPRMRTLG
ncbi:phage terminase large subunit [Streptomyces sp. Ag109_O5-1]|uniref:phage terminase large subunit n=1 Tax=Streptomyces sp. Ag109_O5-1 TaxID=1938851 RepID=UPI000F50C6DD|nr:phage terminase large subunit [Streptomyces sp. Ag109_O5-1]RPE40261.1 phage terminase large subunit [Streptomyces sp. Ag109_O5-1]